ncbi:MAG: DMT family transporter [Lachnoclostridium sp.]|nr:DMT family transporter [Lachnoclostridium sp.]
MTAKLKGCLSMLGANVMWGLMAPIAKLAMGIGLITPLLLTDFRIAGAAILFWIYSFFCPKEVVPAADKLRLLGAALCGILFNQGCYIFGVGMTSPGEASVITTTMPLWVMVLAAFILREPITLKKVGGILLGMTGAVMLVTGNLNLDQAGGRDNMVGDLLVLAAQLSYACYLTFYKNFIKKYSVVTLMKWMFTFAAVLLLPFSMGDIMKAQWSSITSMEAWGVAYVVFFATFIAYILVMIGQKNLRPTMVGMFNYVQPIVAMSVGLSLGLEKLTIAKCIAVVLIFTGVWLVSISKSRADIEKR